VQCLKYQFPLPEQVPEQNFSYSDHEALQVTFTVIKTSSGKYFHLHQDIIHGVMSDSNFIIL
jgi:hypothetical protein